HHVPHAPRCAPGRIRPPPHVSANNLPRFFDLSLSGRRNESFTLDFRYTQGETGCGSAQRPRLDSLSCSKAFGFFSQAGSMTTSSCTLARPAFTSSSLTSLPLGNSTITTSRPSLSSFAVLTFKPLACGWLALTQFLRVRSATPPSPGLVA